MQPFDYDHDGLTLRGQLALPAGPGPHPGIMVMHDGQGVSEFMCAKARVLAGLGYAALATDMKETMGLVMPLRQDEPLLRRRVVASFEAFRAHAAVDAHRVGAIGYCFGGQCVLELARSGADARAEWRLTIYSGARHGFTDPVSDAKAAQMDGVGYDALADRLSWAQALSFLDATVRGQR